MGLAGDVTEEELSRMKVYADGLRCWRSQDFTCAVLSFERLSATDPPSRFFLERCRELIENPPASGWDHIYSLHSK
ncbi:MAG: hypothetical protein HC869_11880 [Rhodospirillales bacterium]|nr:hypothetical protein [Rhodospirillales bacterium]